MPSTPLQKTVDRYCAWHKLGRTLVLLQILAFSILVMSALLVVLDKVFFIGLDCASIILYIAGAALLSLLVYVLVMPRRAIEVCYAVDKRAGLKNLLGSAISVESHEDEVSSVVVARAKERMKANSPAKLLPLNLHWTGRYAVIPALLFVGALFLPTFDVLDRQARQQKQEEEQVLVQEVAMNLDEKLTAIEQPPEISENTENKSISQEFNSLAKEMKGITKKEALEKLGEFENKYREDFLEQRDFKETAKALDIKPDLAGLPEETKEQVEDLVDALKGGDFDKTAEALRDLAKQLEGNELAAEDKKQLAEQLQKVAEAMQKNGACDSLAQALQEIDASAEDMQQLMQQCQMAAQEMQDLAELCDSMNNMQAMKEGLSEAKKAMLGDSFSDFNAMEVEEFMEAEAQLGGMEGQCPGPGCPGCGDPNCAAKGNGQGGTGGEGQGKGGNPPEEASATAFKNEEDPSKINKGKILQQLFVAGVPEKGEALAQYSDAVDAAKQHAAGSLAREKIPKEYEDLVKTYFDSLDSSENKTAVPSD